MALGFLKPHLPFNAPIKYWDLYPAKEISLAANPHRSRGAPDAAFHQWGELQSYLGMPKQGPLDEETARNLVHGYQKKAELAQWDVWGRKYVLLGLLAHHDLTADPAVLAAAVRAADYTIGQIGPGRADIAKIGNWSGLAAGSILEPMVLLYRKTGEERFLQFAHYIVRRWGEPGGPDLLRKALGGVSVSKMFPGPDPTIKGYMGGGQSKAYEMMSCYEGLAELYRVTGDASYLQALRLVTADIRTTEITVIGSGSSWERWIGGRTRQTEQVKEWMETCVTATWIKFCSQLLRLTGDPAYGDDIERTAYNALFSAQKPDGSWWCHYNPLAGSRAPAPEQCKAHVNCCVASAPRALFLLPQLGVMCRGDGIAVNLFIPGTAAADLPRGGKVELRTETDYPVGELAADSAGFIPGCERLRTDSRTGGPRLLLTVPFRTENGGETKLRFCDYASAGRTWAEDSAFRVWLPPTADLSQLLTEIAVAADRH